MMTAMPPSCVFWPLFWLDVRVANTTLSPSIMLMYGLRPAASNGALSNGSVKLVVVAEAFGLQDPSPGAAPSG
jgi:hypothetical protein